MEGIPPTLDVAIAERSELDEWLQDFAQRQQQHQGILLRFAFLNGFIAAQPDEKSSEKA